MIDHLSDESTLGPILPASRRTGSYATNSASRESCGVSHSLCAMAGLDSDVSMRGTREVPFLSGSLIGLPGGIMLAGLAGGVSSGRGGLGPGP